MHENKILNPTKNLILEKKIVLNEWSWNVSSRYETEKQYKLSHGNSNGICYLPATLETGNLLDIQPILVPCIASMKNIHYSRYLNG